MRQTENAETKSYALTLSTETAAVWAKRLLLYCGGLLVLATGVALSRLADLGLSPVSALPYILSEVFPWLTMGNWVIVIFCIYILVQGLILRREFRITRLLQLFCTALFGYFTDFANWFTEILLPAPDSLSLPPVGIYCFRWVYMVGSMSLVAMGVMLYLLPKLPSLPCEGVMQVVSEKTGKRFFVIKILFDMSVSLTALIIALVCFHSFHGVREGTIVASFGVGKILGWYAPIQSRVKAWLEA